jgi:hypothetical protein
MPLVFRKVIAVGLSVAVQAAALGAPLVHAHLGGHESEHHHGRQAVHAHLSGHHSHPSAHQRHASRRNFDDDDAESAVYLQLFVAVGVASFELPPAVISSFDLTVPIAAAPRALLHVVHGHDPPSARSLSSRAPPASLS